jgi:methylenetetrahydrofolate reductase (NADPH)
MALEAEPERPNFLRQALARREFCQTAELVLGRDHNVAEAEAFLNEAAAEPNGVRVISVTDLPGGTPALPPESFVSSIRSKGLTPIAHVTGKDGNRSALESRLLAFAHRGVENILALTGDVQKVGLGGQAKPVFDLDSVLILWLVEAMRKGIDYNLGPRTVQSTPFDFFSCAVVNPFKVREADLMMQLYKLQLKIGVGAKYIITQLGYNPRKLYEMKQYLGSMGLGEVPVLANVYVPTAKIARMMQDGEVAGCVISDELIKRLEKEKKPERLERAALMVAAAKDLGFAGAHIGGFNLVHRDYMTIADRAAAIGVDWRGRMDELMFPIPNEFYLYPTASDGLSDATAKPQLSQPKGHPTFTQWLSQQVHRHLIADGSLGARFFGSHLHADGRQSSWRHSLCYKLLEPSSTYRKVTVGCKNCGDCLQDHLDYAGCSMRWCYKELRNGPCGGSRIDGTCEARPDQECIWNIVYRGARAMGDDPQKFARTLIPPRNWSLDGTNALANRFAGIDNLAKRVQVMARELEK